MFAAWRRPLQILVFVISTVLPAAVLAQNPIDINTAASEQLQTLPGIGPAKAAAIIDYRETYGPFSRVEDITNVTGIGDATFERLQALISVGAAVQEPAATATFDDSPTIDLRNDPGNNADQNPLPPFQSDRPASGEPSADAPAADAQALVNINTADEEALQQLPGIGPAKASAIVEHRNANGPFQTVEQLDDVPGIGPATLDRLRPLITL